ncbi:hypothetical protein ACFSTC_56000 [Nonomuraea ferruginea]
MSTTWPLVERMTGGREALDQEYSTWPPGRGRASSMTPCGVSMSVSPPPARS